MAAEVLARVHSGECKRHPRWYFVFRYLLWGALILSLAASVALITSFIFFSEAINGEHHLLSFGWRGVMVFLAILPWSLILLEVVLLVALEVVARKFSFGYRTPILYLFGGVVSFGIFAAALINATPIHRVLLDRADTENLPMVGGWYETVHDSHEAEGVFRGVIVSIATSSFIMAHNDLDNDTDDGVKIVTPPQGMKMSVLTVGDRVIVAGDGTGTVIQAYGIDRW